jgi:hypothetical protein
MAEPSLYERLGGVFAIAAVIDHFSDAVVQNTKVGQASKNPDLRKWHTDQLDRLPGLKFMRTLWVCNVAGGRSPGGVRGPQRGSDRGIDGSGLRTLSGGRRGMPAGRSLQRSSPVRGRG